MQDAVADEEMPLHLVRLVMRRQRRHRALVAGAAVMVALTVAVSSAIAWYDSRAWGPVSSTGSHRTAPPQRLQTKLTGLPWPAGTDLQLLLATPNGTVASLFSTATRQTAPIAGLPPVPTGYIFFRVQGGWTAEGFRGDPACPPGCNEPQYFIADGSATATSIGTGFLTKPSDRIGAVWLQSFPPGTRNGYTTPPTAQLVSTAGSPEGPLYRLPAGYLIDRAVGSYLLLEPYTAKTPTPPYVYELWDPLTGKVIHRLDNVAAAAPEEIAWRPNCRGCHLRILNVSTGKTVTTPIPGGQPLGLFGTFTDDGKLLAVTLHSGAIGVFNTQSRTLTVVPGTTLLARAVPGRTVMTFGWLDGSQRLVITAAPDRCPNNSEPIPQAGPTARCLFNNSLPTQVAYWQPGATRLRLATIPIPGGMWAVVFDGDN
jgi:hypothetical protein